MHSRVILVAVVAEYSVVCLLLASLWQLLSLCAQVTPLPADAALNITIPSLRGSSLYFFTLRIVTVKGSSAPCPQPAVAQTLAPSAPSPPTAVRVVNMTSSLVSVLHVCTPRQGRRCVSVRRQVRMHHLCVCCYECAYQP